MEVGEDNWIVIETRAGENPLETRYIIMKIRSYSKLTIGWFKGIPRLINMESNSPCKPDRNPVLKKILHSNFESWQCKYTWKNGHPREGKKTFSRAILCEKHYEYFMFSNAKKPFEAFRMGRVIAVSSPRKMVVSRVLKRRGKKKIRRETNST